MISVSLIRHSQVVLYLGEICNNPHSLPPNSLILIEEAKNFWGKIFLCPFEYPRILVG
jgi:hypothetical protein